MLDKLFIPKAIQELVNNFDEDSKKNYDQAWLDWVNFTQRKRWSLIELLIGEEKIALGIKKRAIFVLLSPMKKWCPLNWWENDKHKYHEDSPSSMRLETSFIKKLDHESLKYMIKVQNVFMKELSKEKTDNYETRDAFSSYYEIISTLLKHKSKRIRKKAVNSLFNYHKYGDIVTANTLIHFFEDEEIKPKQKRQMQTRFESFLEKDANLELKKKIIRYYKLTIIHFFQKYHGIETEKPYDETNFYKAVNFLMDKEADSFTAREFLLLLGKLPEERNPDFYQKAKEKFLKLKEENLDLLEEEELSDLKELAELLLPENPSKEEESLIQTRLALIQNFLDQKEKKQEEWKKEQEARRARHDKIQRKKNKEHEEKERRVYAALE